MEDTSPPIIFGVKVFETRKTKQLIIKQLFMLKIIILNLIITANISYEYETKKIQKKTAVTAIDFSKVGTYTVTVTAVDQSDLSA